MEKEIMTGVYNYLYDAKHEWFLKDVEIFTNIEEHEIVKFTNMDGKTFYVKLEEEL